VSPAVPSVVLLLEVQVEVLKTSFDKICYDLGVNFELTKSIAFCPAFCLALRAMFKAVSTTYFLLMNPDKKSLSFEKIPEPPT